MVSAEKRREYSVEELLPRTGSVYKLVIIAAKRALEISDGSPKLVESSPKEKPALISLREIGEGRIGMKIKKIKDGEKS
ncbi:MAG: DNA-directed RNA polymerase subunit omega [Candidatus Omnitrophica bacterium]|nr:DNA-directed RNA polymerase subunit omega [Candidatus Omnitrophota bacterium]